MANAAIRLVIALGVPIRWVGGHLFPILFSARSNILLAFNYTRCVPYTSQREGYEWVHRSTGSPKTYIIHASPWEVR